MNYVYVLAPDGKPLMPTTRYGKVRRLLKSGKAIPVQTKPFTIRLTYEPETYVVQDVTIGIDPGRTNIGLAAVADTGKCLYSARCITRNKEIPKLMEKRRQHRQASRRGERLARKRLAKRLGTTMKAVMERILPGYEKPVKVKDIINTEARFNNRYRSAGWLTPTATQLLRTHVNLIQKVQQILPVSGAVLELNRFAFMELEADSKLLPNQYQHGPMYGYDSIRRALEEQQDGVCLLCGKRAIEHNHHMVPRSKGGSDTLANLAGLCEACHELVHKDEKAAKTLQRRKTGINKKYHALSVLNQIIPYLAEKLKRMFGKDRFFATTGYITKQFRDDHKITKDHDIDAYCIACSVIEKIQTPDIPEDSFEILQFRRHDRANIHSQTERIYLYDGKQVAVNRRKRMDQKYDSLEDWYARMVEEHGEKEAMAMRSKLRVKKSQRHYNNKDRVMPGAIFTYHGKRYVLTGQLTGGKYYRAYSQGKKNFPVRECRIVQHNTGLVFV